MLLQAITSENIKDLILQALSHLVNYLVTVNIPTCKRADEVRP